MNINGANCNFEIGAATEMASLHPDGGPVLLFDQIAGYRVGFRILSNPLGSLSRLALTLGLPASAASDKKKALFPWIEKSRNLKPLAPEAIGEKEAPVMENVVTGANIDILRFPAAKKIPG